ncbi:hypothetical protein BJ912DRAFT_925336 [Pholiota molesta]|nr:hypothetical protein BJ912DRAFT_925336 [Pholiota molesta]
MNLFILVFVLLLSPHLFLIAFINYMSLDSPNSDARSSRVTIKDELVGKLVFDDPRVFKCLGLDRISPQFVTSCTEAFITNQQLLSARGELEKITTTATGKSIQELEAEVTDSLGVQKFKKKLTKKRCINLCTQSRDSFQSTDTTVLKSDASTWGFPKGSPDFVIFDRTVPTSEHKGVLWCEIGGFCEVKPTPQQGPKPSKDPKVVKPLVLQAADYTRLHISVLFSPIHDMWNDTKTFIRVIRALTCHLSPVELGQDPTVTILPNEQHILWRIKTKDFGRWAPEDFPTFVITSGGRTWYTVGLPIWTSVSLLGRGTSIWLVRANGTGPVFVLKNTWRSVARLSESVIYGSVIGHHPALAKLHLGEDVCFPGEERYITTDNLRGPNLEDEIEGEGVILHRLILESRGRPLWEYRSEKELLEGIRAAVSAHEFLCEQGILHRDISAGNIMLPAETPSEAGAEAFLMDLEFAHIKRSSLDTTTTTVVPPVRAPGGRMLPL